MNSAGDVEPTTGDAMRLLRLLRTIEILRLIEPDMPMQRAATFLTVATMSEGCTVRHISDQLDIYVSTAHRNTAALSDTHWRGKPGLGLITSVPDPEESRRNLFTLTAKGKRVVKSLLSAMGEESL